MTDLVQVTTENIGDVLQEIDAAFYDIPFENSAFQNENFVIAAQMTPERAYRAIGLRMHSKIAALKEAKYGRLKEEIDIEELQAKIDNPDTNTYDRRRAQLDIQQKLDHHSFTDKLINDALSELNLLYKHFQAMPRYTREQFEQGERIHFEQKLTRQIQGLAGAHESLINMTQDVNTMQALIQEQMALLGSE
jgi:hypothetical protein